MVDGPGVQLQWHPRPDQEATEPRPHAPPADAPELSMRSAMSAKLIRLDRGKAMPHDHIGTQQDLDAFRRTRQELFLQLKQSLETIEDAQRCLHASMRRSRANHADRRKVLSPERAV